MHSLAWSVPFPTQDSDWLANRADTIPVLIGLTSLILVTGMADAQWSGWQTDSFLALAAALRARTAQNICRKAKFGLLTSLSTLTVAGAADARRSHWHTGWCWRLQPRGGMPCWRPDLAVAKPDFGSPRTYILNTYTVIATGAAGSRLSGWRTGWCWRWRPRGVTPWRPPASQTCCIPPLLAGPQVRCRAPGLLP